MRRELTYRDTEPNKFWTIEQQGNSHTVSCGQIGNKGESSTKSFPSEGAARQDAERLIKEKTGQGYVDATEDKFEEAGGERSISLDAFANIHHRDDVSSNASTFVGRPVADYQRDKPIDDAVVYRFRSHWKSQSANLELAHFLARDEAPETTALVIGDWHGDDVSRPPDDVIAVLVEQCARLPKLAALYLGDITSEENEISWIYQTDLSPLLSVFPSLQFLRSRGGQQLAISKPEHANLRGLAMETGGMDASVVRSLGVAKFPNLEYLELWLGTDEYGATITVDDLRPILLGEAFPKLKYLGLRNSEIADAVAVALVDSPVVRTIETLDLSLGVLTDEGGKALLCLKSPSLKKLNLHHHFLSPEIVDQLKAMPLIVDAANPSDLETGEGYRYVAVGE